MLSPEALPARLERVPGLDRLLPALAGLPPAHLVGGAVRDLLRGADAVDLDIAVEGDAAGAAEALAGRLGGEATEHGRFGTATVRAPGISVDLAATRRETYAEPGVLPEVEPAPLAEDLGRRDFGVNAMAVALTGEPGRLEDPHGGYADLAAGRIRILHTRSFLDDPTRLLRAVRYEARLGFAMDDETERLAREAIAAGAMRTVSGPRVRDELIDLLGEEAVAAAIDRLAELGLDRALDPALGADAARAAAAASGAVEMGADRRLAALAALVAPAPDALEAWVEELHLGAGARDAVMRAARKGPGLAAALRSDLDPAALHALLHCEPPEALALAIAHGASAGQVSRYVSSLRDVALEITGDDLVAAGIEPSPAVGRALAETLRRKLNGELSGREDELATAVALAREEP